MNSLAHGRTAKPVGSQQPRVRRIPELTVGSRIDDALDLWELTGRSLFPWQEDSLDAILSLAPDGRWAASEFGLLVARQNGKGDILAAYEIAQLYLFDNGDPNRPKFILHTAHQHSTANEAFLRVKQIILSTPALRRRLKGGGTESSRGISGIDTSAGRLSITLENGARLLFQTRTANAGVGFTVDNLVIDEAQKTPLENIEGLLPITRAVRNKQILFTGTVPTGLDDGTYFEGLRDRGRHALDPRGGWIEFTPEGSDDPALAQTIDLFSPDVWRQANPSLGLVIDEDDMASEVIRMDASNRDALTRQLLSIWPDPPKDDEDEEPDKIDPAKWRASARPNLQPAAWSNPVLAVAVGGGAQPHATISAAGWFLGKVAVRTVDTRPQRFWVIEALREWMKALGTDTIALDEMNAATILPDLSRAEIPWKRLGTRDVVGSYGLIVEAVNNGRLVHGGQVDLDLSLQHAATREVRGGGMTWAQGSPTEPITQIQSVTFAHWAARQAQQPDTRRTGAAVFRK